MTRPRVYRDWWYELGHDNDPVWLWNVEFSTKNGRLGILVFLEWGEAIECANRIARSGGNSI